MYTPALRATTIEFSDVANSRATDLMIKSGSTNFMTFNVSNGINIYKTILMNNNALSGIASISAAGDAAGGTITPTAGSISSLSGNIQTIHITVVGQHGVFQNLACIGMTTLTVPASRGIVMGLDSNTAGGIEFCADTNQYINLQLCLVITKGDLFTMRQTMILKCLHMGTHQFL